MMQGPQAYRPRIRGFCSHLSADESSFICSRRLVETWSLVVLASWSINESGHNESVRDVIQVY